MADAADQSCRPHRSDSSLRPRVALGFMAVPRPLPRRRTIADEGVVTHLFRRSLFRPLLSPTLLQQHSPAGERGLYARAASGSPDIVPHPPQTRPRVAFMNNPG